MANFLLWLFLLLVALLHFSYVDCCVEEERLALLEIKAYMKSHSDATSYTTPWFNTTVNERSSSFSYNCCQWEVVRCSVSTGRVTDLDLSRKVARDYDDIIANLFLFNVTLFRPFRDLVSLDLSNNYINGLFEDNGSTKISTLKNLKNLKLDANIFKTGYISLSELTALRTLNLRYSMIGSNFSFQDLANLRELQILDLSNNFLNNTMQGLCELRNLQQLDLQYNSLTYDENLPSCIRNLSSLEILNLSENQFKGKLPSSLSNLTSLKFLDLSSNYFEGKWSLNSLRNLSRLHVLRLSANKLEVQTEDSPWLPSFQLQSLHLQGCNLNKPNGTIPKFLLHQYNLNGIDLTDNNLVGSFPTWLLSNNPHLRVLFLANNSLGGRLQLPQHPNIALEYLDVSRNNIQGEVPENIGSILPELVDLNMSKNHFDGHIPTSLGDMKKLGFLDLSDNSFSGEIPRRIFSNCNSLDTLQLSNNSLDGEMIPEDMNLPILSWLKLSNNRLGGTIKNGLMKSTGLYYLDMSYNKVTGELPQWIGNFSELNVLSMSRNDLQGHIPRELCKIRYLEYMDLSQNNLSGPIPSCFNFSSLEYMDLQGNSLTGKIPSVLSSCSNLKTLVLKNNQLSGGIPYWINKLSSLNILLLSGNDFQGQIPKDLCQLKKINILDLSRNNLSGKIPICFGNMSFGINFYSWYEALQPLENYSNDNDTDSGFSFSQYVKPYQVEFLEKNQYLSYTPGVLVLMAGLDLSCNKLTGVIPPELGHLRKLHSLNLSHNHLIGSIPSSFSGLNQIESLDLSCNNLTGMIPPQLVDLTFLSAFNVSYNSLTGRVPEAAQFAAFDEWSYLGNPGLFGFPNNQLHNHSTTLAPDVPNKGEGQDEDSYRVDFLWSFGMSCAIMFLATVMILCINPQWRRAWFDFVDWHLLWWTSVPLLCL